jgi:hypothetical protein
MEKSSLQFITCNFTHNTLKEKWKSNRVLYADEQATSATPSATVGHQRPCPGLWRHLRVCAAAPQLYARAGRPPRTPVDVEGRAAGGLPHLPALGRPRAALACSRLRWPPPPAVPRRRRMSRRRWPPALARARAALTRAGRRSAPNDDMTDGERAPNGAREQGNGCVREQGSKEARCWPTGVQVMVGIERKGATDGRAGHGGDRERSWWGSWCSDQRAYRSREQGALDAFCASCVWLRSFSRVIREIVFAAFWLAHTFSRVGLLVQLIYR